MSIREELYNVRSDIRYAVRGVRRELLFSGFIIVTLALAIGVNAAMFGIVDKLLLQGPAYVRDPGHVVRLYWNGPLIGGATGTTAAFENVAYANIRAEAHRFTGVAMYSPVSRYTYVGEGNDARLITTAMATSNFMSVLGAPMQLGRFFTIEEQESDVQPPLVVLGYGIWRSDFGGDPKVLGRSILLDGRSSTIIGVAPAGFTGVELDRVDVWRVLPAKVGTGARHWLPNVHSNGPRVVARLKPGITLEEASEDATSAHRRTYDAGERPFAQARILARPLRFGESGNETTEASIARWLIALSMIVLLSACANIINLLLARIVRQRREIAVRLALGAGHARMTRYLLTNCLLLALMGGLGALVVAFVVGGTVRRMLLPQVEWTSGPVDLRVLTFSLAAAVMTGLLVGVVPAFRVGQTDLMASLKAGVGAGGGNRSGIRSVLMLVQSALAMVLLVAAGLFARSMTRVASVDLGMQPDRVVWLNLRRSAIPTHLSTDERAREETRRRAFAADIIERLRVLPGVEHAALASVRPFGGWATVAISVPGRGSVPRVSGSEASITGVSSDYFATLGMRLLQGRPFADSDREGAELVAIVNSTMAKAVWSGRSPLNECLIIGSAIAKQCSRVIGVVHDTRRSQIREEPTMQYYVPLAQRNGVTSGSQILIRPHGDARAAIPAIKTALRQMDQSIAFINAGTVQDAVEAQTGSWRLGAMMFLLFAGLALVVVGVGMFSVVSYLVEQRRYEIGVRVALGARTGDVVSLMMRDALQITAAGVLIGALVALTAGSVAQPLLFETNARDPVVIGSVGIVLILVSIVASGIPALRARSIDPICVLSGG